MHSPSGRHSAGRRAKGICARGAARSSPRGRRVGPRAGAALSSSRIHGAPASQRRLEEALRVLLHWKSRLRGIDHVSSRDTRSLRYLHQTHLLVMWGRKPLCGLCTPHSPINQAFSALVPKSNRIMYFSVNSCLFVPLRTRTHCSYKNPRIAVSAC